MTTMTTLPLTAATRLTALSLIGTLAIACSVTTSDDPGSSENTGARAEALTGEVETHADQPTGDVGGADVNAILDAYSEIDFAIGDLGLPCDLDPFDFQAASDCNISTEDGATDVSCISGGDAEGTAAVDVHVSDGNTYVHYDLQNVCAADRDVCVTGEGAVKVSNGGEVTVAGDLTIVRGGETNHIKYGVTVSGASVEIVLWHNGQSFVIDDGALGGFGLEGSDGSWSCDIDGSIEDFSADLAGECSAGADF